MYHIYVNFTIFLSYRERNYSRCRQLPAGTSCCIQALAGPIDLALRLSPIARAPAIPRPYSHPVANIRGQSRDRIVRGQQLGTVGKGANNIYPAHLHLDMPRARTYVRARTYYDTTTGVSERFIDPLSQIPATI